MKKINLNDLKDVKGGNINRNIPAGSSASGLVYDGYSTFKVVKRNENFTISGFVYAYDYYMYDGNGGYKYIGAGFNENESIF